jgi:Immunity protein 26
MAALKNPRSRQKSREMKPSYPNGSVFLVPLNNGGFARGVVAQSAPAGKLLLGYFFGPRLASTSEIDLFDLEPKNAVLCVRFGDLGLFKGVWPVVGKLPDWNPAQWPMIVTVRRDPLGKMKPVLIRYADSDPSRRVSEETLENDNDLPADGLAGYGFVEAKLTKLLA